MQRVHAQPMVSVWMITYNHEPFIVQALESILSQKTTFDIEIVIGEDCSTDLTRAIVKEYAEKFPHKIKLLLHPQTIGVTPNFAATFQKCRGKYVALLEGDDYWTDPYKLEKQVEFLEASPEFVTCFHWVDILYEDSGEIRRVEKGPPGPPVIKPYYTLDDILHHNIFIPTCSTMVRNKVFTTFPEWFGESILGDFMFHILQAQHGNIGFLDERMAVHRMHRGGVSGGQPVLKTLEKIVRVYPLTGKHLGLTHRTSYRWGVACMNIGLSLEYRQDGRWLKSWFTYLKGLTYAPYALKKNLFSAYRSVRIVRRGFQLMASVYRMMRIYGLLFLRRWGGKRFYNWLKYHYRLVCCRKKSQ